MTKKLLFTALSMLFFTGLYAQSINGIAPNKGNQGQTLPIIVSGQNTSFAPGQVNMMLTQGSYTIGQGTGTGFQNVTVSNSATISANLSIPGSATLGFYDLWVFGSGSSTLYKPMAFEVRVPGTPLIAMTPNGSQPGNVVNATFQVSGANFKTSMVQLIDKVWLSYGNEVLTDISNIQVVNATTFTADVNVPAGTTNGFWDVNVYTDDEVMFTSQGAFEISNTFSRKEQSVLDVSLYPNPATDRLTATFKTPYTAIDVELFDLTGKRIARNNYTVEHQGNSVTVHTKDLPHGSYMVQFSAKEEVLATKQFVRQ